MTTRDKFGIGRISRAKTSSQPSAAVSKVPVAVRPETAAAGDRHTRRKTTRALGFIIDHGGKELECTVHDISSTGAKVTLNLGPRKAFEAVPSIPETFRLAILQDSVEVDAKRAWTHGNTLGVEFLSPFRPARRSALARL